MKRWKQKLIVSLIMVAIGVVFIFGFRSLIGNVWLAAAVLMAWMQ